MVRPKWEEMMIRYFQRKLPDNYLCFDLETTGFKKDDDLPLDYGWCLIRDRQCVDRGSYILDWTRTPEWVDPAWLRDKLNYLHQCYARDGKCWTYTWERLQAEGKDPRWVLDYAHTMLDETYKAGHQTVGHNIYPFDRPMLTHVFIEFLAKQWPVPCDGMLDTGCLEKAAVSSDILNPEYHIRPTAGESPTEFFKRCFNKKAAGVKWGLETCFDRYNLEEKFGLVKDDLHGAEVDSYACHVLLELNRE